MPTANAMAFWVAYALFATHALTLLLASRSPEWRTGAFEGLATAVRPFVRMCSWKHDVLDEVSKEVSVRMLARQLRQFKNLLQLLTWFFLLFLLLDVFKWHHNAQCRLSLPHDPLTLIGYATTLLTDSRVLRVTERNLDVWYSCAMAAFCLHMFMPFCSYESFHQMLFNVRVLIALMALARMRLPIVAFWSGIRVLCTAGAIVAHESRLDASCVQALVSEELSLFIAQVIIVGFLEARALAELRRDVETRTLEDKQAAVNALLSNSYDVVVELDHDSRIVGPTPHLAALLLRSAPTSLERVPFEDLLVGAEDRACFHARLRTAQDPPSFAQVSHLQMQASNNSVVPVELFTFHYRGSGGQSKYLLGVREFGDLSHNGTHEPGSLPHSGTQAAQAASQPDTAVDQVGTLGEVVAVVDPFKTTLPILDRSTSFGLRIMSVAEGSLLTPALAQGTKFVDWLQEKGNQEWNGEGDADGEDWPPSFDVTFRPRRGSITCVQAVCTVSFSGGEFSDCEAGSAGECKALLTFSHIVQVPRPSSRGSSNRYSSSSSSTPWSSGTQRDTPRRLLGDRPLHGSPRPSEASGRCDRASVGAVGQQLRL